MDVKYFTSNFLEIRDTTGMSLNSEQLRAVSIIDGPLLILAGAGSGKTHTLTERVYSMIKEV